MIFNPLPSSALLVRSRTPDVEEFAVIASGPAVFTKMGLKALLIPVNPEPSPTKESAVIVPLMVTFPLTSCCTSPERAIFSIVSALSAFSACNVKGTESSFFLGVISSPPTKKVRYNAGLSNRLVGKDSSPPSS